MKAGSFEFNLRELAGSMGDFGTFFTLAIGYIVVCGLNPAGFLVMMGLADIATGLVYRLPMPIEPIRVLAVVAITQRWSPTMVCASGFGMGAIWLLFGLTGIMGRIGGDHLGGYHRPALSGPHIGWSDHLERAHAR